MNDVNAQTATDLFDQMEHIERIAHGDFLSMLAAAMPYLLERREIARRLVEFRHPDGHKIIQSINKELAEVLLISYNPNFHQLNKK